MLVLSNTDLINTIKAKGITSIKSEVDAAPLDVLVVDMITYL